MTERTIHIDELVRKVNESMDYFALVWKESHESDKEKYPVNLPEKTFFDMIEVIYEKMHNCKKNN